MNAAAAKVIVQGFLAGAFDVFDAMLSMTFTHQPAEPQELSAAALNSALEQYPVLLSGRIEGELGAVAVLFTSTDAVRIASFIADKDAGERAELDDEDREVLKEMAAAALGSGVTNLMERFGRNVEQLDQVEVLDRGTEGADALMEMMGGAGAITPFSFDNSAGFAGEAMALHSQTLEELVPPDQLPESGADAGELGQEPTLSSAEMGDILSGFGPEGEPGGAAPETPDEGPQFNESNLGMVLDIRLEATARLGRVHKPISEILNLGPGSILEMGHLVDEPVELLINDKLVARGDVVVIDEKFGLRITEIISTRERIESFH